MDRTCLIFVWLLIVFTGGGNELVAQSRTPPSVESTQGSVIYFATNRRVESVSSRNASFFGRFGDTLAILGIVVGAVYLRSELRADRRRGVALGVATMVASLGLLGIHFIHRQTTATSRSFQMYSADRGTLSFGKHVERTYASTARSDSKGNTLNLRSVVPSTFFQELDANILKSDRHELLLFVHGFNVDFRLAIEDSKQLARSLSFDTTTVCFSWPSQGSVLDYTVDETNAEWSIPHLKQFLIDLSNQTHASAIHIIAHSMGNRLITESVRELADEWATKGKPLGHLVLAAPDVDTDRFCDELAEPMRRLSRTVTIYTSSKDRALALSRKLHGSPRLGDSTFGPVIVEGIDTVDVTESDLTYLGHGYYEEDKQVLLDIFQVLHHHRQASQRVGLVADRHGQGGFWRLKPTRVASSTNPVKLLK